MAEPGSTSLAVAGGVGAGLAGFLAGINGEAAVGALCGSLLYFAVTQELPLPRRMMFFAISFVMGYLFAPAMAKAQLFGIGPIDLPGPAAFIASALVVTVTLAAIRQRSKATATGGYDG